MILRYIHARLIRDVDILLLEGTKVRNQKIKYFNLLHDEIISFKNVNVAPNFI